MWQVSSTEQLREIDIVGDRIMAPQRHQALILKPVNATLHGKRCFVDMTKGRVLVWEMILDDQSGPPGQ